MKKTLIFLITVIALVICLAVVSSAEDVIHSGTWGDLSWELNETTGALVISGNGDMYDFEHDSTSAWLEYKDKIKTVTIENGVTSIGACAFCNCSSLTSIVIPDSVTSIGEGAFEYCVQINSVSIPDSVISIGGYAFSHCSMLTSIVIPDSVTSIGDYAVAFCSNLKSLTIGRKVTDVGDYSFAFCHNLVNATVYSQNVIDLLTSQSSILRLLNSVKTIAVYSDATVPSYVINNYNNILSFTADGKSLTLYSKCNHNFIGNTCDSGIYCVRCEFVIKGHSFTNYISDNNATCTEDGTMTAKCDRCDATDTVADADTKLGHDYADATSTAPKTCKRNGCGATKAEAIPMLTGCGGGSGVSAAFISCGGITALWFTFKRRIFHH